MQYPYNIDCVIRMSNIHCKIHSLLSPACPKCVNKFSLRRVHSTSFSNNPSGKSELCVCPCLPLFCVFHVLYCRFSSYGVSLLRFDLIVFFQNENFSSRVGLLRAPASSRPASNKHNRQCIQLHSPRTAQAPTRSLILIIFSSDLCLLHPVIPQRPSANRYTACQE